MKQTFSLIVPIFNVDKYIEKFIMSVIDQTLNFEDHVELILVNDGSTDNSESICKKWQKKYPKNIKYFFKQNGGLSSTRNFGIEKASGEWISFPDPDDWYERDYLEKIFKAVNCGTDVNAIFSDIKEYFEKDNRYVHWKIPSEVIVNMNNSVISYCATVNNCFYKKDIIIEKNLLFNTKLPISEDVIFNLNYLIVSNKLYYYTDAIYFYRRRSDNSSLTNKKLNISSIVSLIKYGINPILNNIDSSNTYAYKDLIYFRIVKLILWNINLDFLPSSEYEKKGLIDLLKETFRHIPQYIYKQVGLNQEYMIGFMNLFLNKEKSSTWITITSYDIKSNSIIAEYSFFKEPNLVFFALNEKMKVKEKSRKQHYIFNDLVLYTTVIYEINLNNINLKNNLSIQYKENQYLHIKINDKLIFNNLISLKGIINNFKNFKREIKNKQYYLFSKHTIISNDCEITRYNILYFLTILYKYKYYKNNIKYVKYSFLFINKNMIKS